MKAQTIAANVPPPILALSLSDMLSPLDMSPHSSAGIFVGVRRAGLKRIAA
jgi:hypothetical protein